MANILSKGSLFPEELIPGFIQKTTGASALAKLCGATPIPFNGQKEFTFTLDKEVDIVAENGAKGTGGLTVEPITIVPLKIEYGARVSDEFLYASEDAQMDVLSAFADGFAKKVAKGLDLMAFHGINPRTGTASGVIGTNHFTGALFNKFGQFRGRVHCEGFTDFGDLVLNVKRFGIGFHRTFDLRENVLAQFVRCTTHFHLHRGMHRNDVTHFACHDLAAAHRC